MRNDENLPEPKDQQTLTDNANLAKEWKPFPLPTPTYPCKAHNIAASETRNNKRFHQRHRGRSQQSSVAMSGPDKSWLGKAVFHGAVLPGPSDRPPHDRNPIITNRLHGQ
ncbi:unnamed protein product [Gadus morhua 'NCC']